jgi:regulator of cell morphogenesis and NO signaling
MTTYATKTVRDIAVEFPGSTRVFEKIGIDYCCGGGKLLKDACVAAGLKLNDVLNSLQQAEVEQEIDKEFMNWQSESPTKLISYIVLKHHSFTRQELERIENLLLKVCSVHGVRHPELINIQATFSSLKEELIPHMYKEENVLFPYINRMEEAMSKKLSFNLPPFGTVHNPLRVMMYEHDRAGELLSKIRELSGNYSVPEDGCISFKTLYQALEGLELDLHQHIHLENNILFPRAAEMESKI